ncbi:MAG: glycosyl transferase, partial [Kiritimatiellia bacterium]
MAGIVQNILSHDGTTSVYDTTGPHVLNRVLAGQALSSRPHRHVCIQGAFTNEHFQYLDKPRGKWTYQSPKDLIKQ